MHNDIIQRYLFSATKQQINKQTKRFVFDSFTLQLNSNESFEYLNEFKVSKADDN